MKIQNYKINNYLRMKGYIYLIFNKNGTYIGSSFDVEKRISVHKRAYKYWLADNENRYCSSYKIIKDEFKYEIIEEVQVNNKIELLQWEQYYMDKWECVNENKAYRSIEEEKQYQKEYQKENREHMDEYHKQYNKENQERIKQQQKEYRLQNKDKISEKAREKMTCECGSIIRKSDKTRHIKTVKHVNYEKK
jgi:hypothetical protein